MTLQWNHRTAVVNGLSMHDVTHGQGAPVILLHGWPEFWYSWRHQIPVLAERFEVIAPDLRGFGYSDKPLAGYDSRSAAADIYELDVHFISSLPVKQRLACTAWADKMPVQMVWAVR
jgi:pimeloyl-ACP methyl ester carboxylesterase